MSEQAEFGDINFKKSALRKLKERDYLIRADDDEAYLARVRIEQVLEEAEKFGFKGNGTQRVVVFRRAFPGKRKEVIIKSLEIDPTDTNGDLQFLRLSKNVLLQLAEIPLSNLRRRGFINSLTEKE